MRGITASKDHTLQILTGNRSEARARLGITALQELLRQLDVLQVFTNLLLGQPLLLIASPALPASTVERVDCQAPPAIARPDFTAMGNQRLLHQWLAYALWARTVQWAAPIQSSARRAPTQTSSSSLFARPALLATTARSVPRALLSAREENIAPLEHPQQEL